MPLPGERGSHLHHLEEIGTVHNIGINAHTSPVYKPAAAVNETRSEQARYCQRNIEAKVIGVEVSIRAVASFASLPLVRRVKVGTELLASSKQVLVSNSHL